MLSLPSSLVHVFSEEYFFVSSKYTWWEVNFRRKLLQSPIFGKFFFQNRGRDRGVPSLTPLKFRGFNTNFLTVIGSVVFSEEYLFASSKNIWWEVNFRRKLLQSPIFAGGQSSPSGLLH